MKTMNPASSPLNALRCLCRYETHGGYTWAAVMSDGELMCVPCLRANYRQVFQATRTPDLSGWVVIGLTHSGEAEGLELCCNCNKVLWHQPD